MKKLALMKASIDFAYANYNEGAIKLASSSLAAFVAAGGQDADLTVWNQKVAVSVAEATQFARQKLPSEIPSPNPAAQPASNATAATVAPEVAEPVKS